MSQKPIEINEGDLIERPLDWKPGTPPPKRSDNWLQRIREIREFLEMIPELRKIAQDLGLNLPGQTRSKPELEIEVGPPDRLQISGSASQVQLIIRVLMAQYGDITINELLEKLRLDMGERKLSSFSKESSK